MNTQPQPADIKSIAIIEDDEPLRTRAVKFINSFRDIVCIADSADIDGFLSAERKLPLVDLLFLDITLQGQSCLAQIPKLRKSCPNADIVLFTVSDKSEDLFRGLTLGATGYFVKTGSTFDLRRQIDIFLAGGSILSPTMAKMLIQHFNPGAMLKIGAADASLGERDQQVLQLLAQGFSYAQIGEQLGLSVDAVRYYVKKIYRVLHVKNKVDAIRHLNQMQGND